MPYSSRPRTWGAKSASTERWLNRITSGDDSDFTGTSLQTSPRLQIRPKSPPPHRPRSPTRLGLTYELHMPTTKLNEIRAIEARDDDYYMDIMEEDGTKIGDNGITTYSARSWARRQVSSGKPLPTVNEAPQESPRDVLRALSRSLNSSSSASVTKEIDYEVAHNNEVAAEADDEADDKVAPYKYATHEVATEAVVPVPSTPDQHSQAPLTPELTPEVPARPHFTPVVQAGGYPKQEVKSQTPSTPDMQDRAQASAIDGPKVQVKAPTTPEDEKQPVEQNPVVAASASMFRPTPRVTGAYLDTPTRTPGNRTPYTRGRVSSAPTLSTRTQLQAPTARHHLINTAKITTAAEDLLALQAQLDGSQFDHEGFLQGFESGKFRAHSNSGPCPELEQDDGGLPLSLKELERRQERLALERMTESMKKTSSSIRDARHGIERLEQQVATSIHSPAGKSKSRVSLRWMWAFLTFVFLILFASLLTPSRRQSAVDNWEPYTPWFPWAATARASVLTASDYWGGESGPVGIVHEEVFGIWDDERL